jgi:hypothetical protein
MRDRRRTVGLVLVGISIVLLGAAALLDSVVLAVALVVVGTIGFGLLMAVLADPDG